jgi:hypothetical protein
MSNHLHLHLRRTVVAGLALAAALPLSAATTASAKESAGTFSSAPLPPPPACQAVQSLKASGDARVGDLNFASIQVDYSVKPCDSKQVVAVETLMWENFDPSNVVWDDPAAPTSGRFTVTGVKRNTNYRVTVVVRDAANGVEVSRLSILASADTRTTA